MAQGLNRVTLIGNVGQDPELRYTQGGQPILNMRMATTETFLDREKEKQERTEWHTIVMWGKRGESLNRFISKGSRLCVEGRLQTRSWEGKDGGKRYTTEIVATNIVLLGGGQKNGGQDSGQGGGYRNDGPPPHDDYHGGNGGGGNEFGDDDVPF